MGEIRRIPEVVASDETLEACADIRVAKVLSELDGLVARAVSVAQVCALGIAQVDAEALRRAGEIEASAGISHAGRVTHNPMARAKFKIPASVRTAGELRPEMTTCGNGG